MPDFNRMSKSELRTYLVNHPSDRAAFHIFIDRFAQSTSPVFTMPQTQLEVNEIEQRIKQKLSEIKDLV
jgi:hypothetical protein